MDISDLLSKNAAEIRGISKRYDGSELPLRANVDQVGADYTGLGSLSAGQMIKPRMQIIYETAGTQWTEIHVLKRKVRIFDPNLSRTFYYTQNPLTDSGTSIISNKRCAIGLGYVDLPEGEWLVATPIVTAEGTQVRCVLQDAALGNAFDVGSSTGTTGAAPSDIRKIGGQDQTALDLTAKFVPITWGDAVEVTVNAADVLILAANPLRRALAFFNSTGAGTTRIAIGVTNPMTGVLGIWNFDPGVGEVYTTPQHSVTQQALRGYASAAAGKLIVAEGT